MANSSLVVTSAYLLTDKAHKPLKITKVGEGLDIALPAQPLDPIATVVALNTN
jgi:alpha-L-fucosidase